MVKYPGKPSRTTNEAKYLFKKMILHIRFTTQCQAKSLLFNYILEDKRKELTLPNDFTLPYTTAFSRIDRKSLHGLGKNRIQTC